MSPEAGHVPSEARWQSQEVQQMGDRLLARAAEFATNIDPHLRVKKGNYGNVDFDYFNDEGQPVPELSWTHSAAAGILNHPVSAQEAFVDRGFQDSAAEMLRKLKDKKSAATNPELN